MKSPLWCKGVGRSTWHGWAWHAKHYTTLHHIALHHIWDSDICILFLYTWFDICLYTVYIHSPFENGANWWTRNCFTIPGMVSIPSEVNEDNEVKSSILGRGVPQQSLLHCSIESCDGKPLSPWLVLFSWQRTANDTVVLWSLSHGHDSATSTMTSFTKKSWICLWFPQLKPSPQKSESVSFDPHVVHAGWNEALHNGTKAALWIHDMTTLAPRIGRSLATVAGYWRWPLLDEYETSECVQSQGLSCCIVLQKATAWRLFRFLMSISAGSAVHFQKSL